MPRRIRLLCAACLVEGLGLDWRHGRDWFAYTLIDHDPSINDAMWQNAALQGVDPFYRGLRWEVAPEEEEEEEEEEAEEAGEEKEARAEEEGAGVGAEAGAPDAAEGGESSNRRNHCRERCNHQISDDVDEDGESSGYSASYRYVRRWLRVPRSALPPWPPPLHAAAAKHRPSLAEVQRVAAARREWLTAAYVEGARICRAGIRIELADEAAEGEAAEGEAAEGEGAHGEAAEGEGAHGEAANGAAGALERAPVAPLPLGAPSLYVGCPKQRDRLGVGHMAFRLPPLRGEAQ